MTYINILNNNLYSNSSSIGESVYNYATYNGIETIISPIDNNIQNINGESIFNYATYNGIGTTITPMDNYFRSIVELDTTVNSLNTSVTFLSKQYTTVNTFIAPLTSQYNTISNQYATVTNKLITLNDKLTSVNTLIQAASSPDYVNSLLEISNTFNQVANSVSTLLNNINCLTLNTNKSIPSNVLTALTWDTANTINPFWTISDPTKITIPFNNMSNIVLTVSVEWDSNPTGYRKIIIVKNGTISNGVLTSGTIVAKSTVSAVGIFSEYYEETVHSCQSQVLPVVKNDYFQVYVLQSTTGSLNINSVPYTYFKLE